MSLDPRVAAGMAAARTACGDTIRPSDLRTIVEAVLTAADSAALAAAEVDALTLNPPAARTSLAAVPAMRETPAGELRAGDPVWDLEGRYFAFVTANPLDAGPELAVSYDDGTTVRFDRRDQVLVAHTVADAVAWNWRRSTETVGPIEDSSSGGPSGGAVA